MCFNQQYNWFLDVSSIVKIFSKHYPLSDSHYFTLKARLALQFR
jgi:hypothetical protein